MAEKAQISIADLVGLDMTGVEEKRFTLLPKGNYTFQGMTAKLEPLGVDDTPAAIIQFKVLETHGLVDLEAGVEETSFVGEDHREVFFLRDLDGVGRLKAFLVDIGVGGQGALGMLVKKCEGHIFPGKIKHRPDKNDKTIFYANINVEKKKTQKAA